MKNIIGVLCLAAVTVIINGCCPETLPAMMESGPVDSDRIAVRLEVDGIPGAGAQTRSPMLEGCEEIMSGAYAYVFYSDSGLLDSVQELSVTSPSSEISLPVGRGVDIYVLGNLWAVGKSDSGRVELSEALGAAFPSDAVSFLNLAYRIDGGSINDKFRRESLSEVKTLGIPFSGKTENYVAGSGRTVSVQCGRLFSKISLTIDHEGLDGGLDSGLFQNVSLHIRQANCVLRPFLEEGSKAVSKDDVLDGDCDPSMVNSSLMTFDFYVPENMQGDLLDGSEGQRGKTKENIVSIWGEEKAGLLTYVEFSGRIDPSAGGYGGDVTYRFYLGKDAEGNFDLERNRRYDVTLGFRVSSLFDPYWQVDSDIDDGRSIGIAADREFTHLLPYGQVVAVRRNRPAKFFAYVGSADGRSAPASLRDADYNPENLADNSISTDFISETNDPGLVPRLADLKALGITPSYDGQSGMITFEVTDVRAFRPGEEVSLSLNTVPSGKSFAFRLRTYDDMSVEWDKPVSDKLYEGASNVLRLRGYAGEVAVMSDQGIFKFVPTPQMNSSFVPRQYMPEYCSTKDGVMTLYRFYSGTSGSIANVSIRPVDSFNDGESESTFRLALGNAEAYLDMASARLDLDIRGTPKKFVMRLRDAATRRDIPRSAFDDAVFDRVYGTSDGIPDLSGDVSDSEGPCVAIEATGNTGSGGYREYSIFRSRIGNRFGLQGTENSNDIKCSFGYQLKGYCDVYPDGVRAVYDGRQNVAFTLRLLPAMSEAGELGLEPVYDDYTLWQGNRLDADYSLGSASNPFVTRGTIRFYLDSPEYYDLYAKPLAESSCRTPDGKSPSLVIMQPVSDGPVRLHFEDDGKSTLHSAGPHALCVRVSNIHSGEVAEEILGRFDVFVHFLVGLGYDASTIVPSADKSMLYVYSQIVSDITRTSYGIREFNGGYVDGYSVRVMYTGTKDSRNFPIPSGSGLENCTIRPTMSGERRIGASLSPSYGSYFQAYELSLQGQGSSVSLMSFLADLSDPASPNHQRLAYNLGRNDVGLQFANPVYWDDGDISASKWLPTFDRTGFGDLYVAPEAARGDPDFMRGYYVFHRLGDVKTECADWIPYFNWLAR